MTMRELAIRGRTCVHDECDTVLSIYNEFSACSVHKFFYERLTAIESRVLMDFPGEHIQVIAREIGIAELTATQLVASILRKLQVDSRKHAYKYCQEHPEYIQEYE